MLYWWFYPLVNSTKRRLQWKSQDVRKYIFKGSIFEPAIFVYQKCFVFYSPRWWKRQGVVAQGCFSALPRIVCRKNHLYSDFGTMLRSIPPVKKSFGATLRFVLDALICRGIWTSNFEAFQADIGFGTTFWVLLYKNPSWQSCDLKHHVYDRTQVVEGETCAHLFEHQRLISVALTIWVFFII